MSLKLTEFLIKHFPEKIPEGIFDSDDLVIQILSEIKGVGVPKKFTFSASVYFNHGFGLQNKVIGEVVAENPNEAHKLAVDLANEKIGEDKWLEVQIKPLRAAQ